MKPTNEPIPEGFVIEDNLCYGKRKSHPGLLEIKFNNLKTFNSQDDVTEVKLAELIRKADNDEEVKVILLHGGRFFCSGSDLTAYRRFKTQAELHKYQKYSIGTCMVDMLLAINSCKKPIVAMVRGGAIGIGYTLLNHVTLIYCSPEVKFTSPFMQSGQTPEGTSTLMFPEHYGQKRGNAVLLLDDDINAKQAVQYGFANGIIEGIDPKKDWFDPSIIPAVKKLLDTDYYTIVNAMHLINSAKDNKKIEEVTRREAAASIKKWQNPESINVMLKYMQSLRQKAKAKKDNTMAKM